jgi:hypothetical protein
MACRLARFSSLPVTPRSAGNPDGFGRSNKYQATFHFNGQSEIAVDGPSPFSLLKDGCSRVARGSTKPQASG